MTSFENLTSKYLFKFFEKKDLPYERWEIHLNGSIHLIDNSKIINIILSSSHENQELIAESLIELESKNRDINVFLRNLAIEILETT